MYSPYQYQPVEQPYRVAYDRPEDIMQTQRKLEQQYFNHSLTRPPYSQMSKRYPIGSEYNKAYGTPQGTRALQQANLRSVGKSTLDQIPFSGATAYQEHYQRHPSEAINLNPQLYGLAVPQMPDYPKPRHVRFEGESTYKAAYRNSDIMDRMRQLNSEKINRKDYWSEHHAPFTGSSSYKSQFQPFQVEMRHDPPPPRYPPNLKFNGKTTYTSDFQNFKVELPQRCDVNYLPVPYKNTISNNSHIFYDSNTNKFT